MPRTLVVAHPDPAAVATTSALLRGSDFAVAASARHGKELAEILWKAGPWGVLLDLSLPDHPDAPDFGWFAASKRVREIVPGTRVVVTFDRRRHAMVHAALAAGALAYAEAPLFRKELLHALWRTAEAADPMPFYGRARRLPCQIPAFVRPAAREGTAVQGHVENISESGALLRLPDFVNRGLLLACELLLPDRTTFRARAQVLRSAPHSEGGSAVGVAFTESEAGHAPRLAACIGKALSEGKQAI